MIKGKTQKYVFPPTTAHLIPPIGYEFDYGRVPKIFGENRANLKHKNFFININTAFEREKRNFYLLTFDENSIFKQIVFIDKILMHLKKCTLGYNSDESQAQKCLNICDRKINF